MKPITSKARIGGDIIATAIAATEQTRIEWRIGDLLVIDNWRLLHARSEAERPDPQRSLLRILVEEKTR
jgi:alpha-ketoglutarate-dependent taurine dioxygenase